MNESQTRCFQSIRRVASAIEEASELWRALGAPSAALTALQRVQRCYELAAELAAIEEPTPAQMCDLLYPVIEIGEIELEVFWAWPAAVFQDVMTSPKQVLAKSITELKRAHTSLLADTQKIEIDPPPKKKRRP